MTDAVNAASPTYQNVQIETQPDGVGLLRLARPKAMNALSGALMHELLDALHRFDDDQQVRCIVVTGDDRAFAAGADIKEMAGLNAVQIVEKDTLALWDDLTRVRKPIIAAVSGACFGGGLELAMACDMIIASETAKFGQPEINLGIFPGAGGTQRLTHALGKQLAMEMILNDRKLTAAEALHYGLVNHVYPLDRYLPEALTLAAQIAARAPLAVRMAKETIVKSFDLSLTEGIAFERRAFYFMFSTEDQKEGMQAFIDKRPPNWSGK